MPTSSGHSTYHALELSVEHQMSHGLWLQAYFTWSKLLANTEGGNPGLGGFEVMATLARRTSFDRRADKSVSPSDIPHRLVISYVYELPVGRGKHFLGSNNKPWRMGCWAAGECAGFNNTRAVFPYG